VRRDVDDCTRPSRNRARRRRSINQIALAVFVQWSPAVVRTTTPQRTMIRTACRRVARG